MVMTHERETRLKADVTEGCQHCVKMHGKHQGAFSLFLSSHWSLRPERICRSTLKQSLAAETIPPSSQGGRERFQRWRLNTVSSFSSFLAVLFSSFDSYIFYGRSAGVSSLGGCRAGALETETLSGSFSLFYNQELSVKELDYSGMFA